MSFICKICGEEYAEDERSHDDVCIYCDTTLIDDALKHDGQLF
jgi:hypothetical protein